MCYPLCGALAPSRCYTGGSLDSSCCINENLWRALSAEWSCSFKNACASVILLECSCAICHLWGLLWIQPNLLYLLPSQLQHLSIRDYFILWNPIHKCCLHSCCSLMLNSNFSCAEFVKIISSRPCPCSESFQLQTTRVYCIARLQ